MELEDVSVTFIPGKDRMTGGYWVLLGPDVEHRRTEYDLDRARAAMRPAAIQTPTGC